MFLWTEIPESLCQSFDPESLLHIDNERVWEVARLSNRPAAKFAEAVEHHPEAELEYPVHANEVFVQWSKEGFDHLMLQDFQFGLWPGRTDLARFVFGHSTSDEEVEILLIAMNGFGI